jgi:hypothetical protein
LTVTWARSSSAALLAVLLEKTEQGTAQDDGQDDQCIHPVFEHRRKSGSKEQDEDNRALELVEKDAQGCGLILGRQDVGTERRQALQCIGGREPTGCALQVGQQAFRWLAPVLTWDGHLFRHLYLA